MLTKNKTQLVKDLSAKKITVTREFDASPAKVWKAWTEKELLEQWWAPKPWRAVSKEMDFRVGGHWLYAMIGPDNEKHWSRADFTEIDPGKSFSAKDYFCDENGKPINSITLKSPEGTKVIKEPPVMNWKNRFEASGTGTKVTVEITFSTEDGVNKILETGFEQGFSMAHENLDLLLSRSH